MTGRRPFGGLILDVKRKAPFYVSDFKDALHAQSLGALLFLYFACLTPIITFGGLLVARHRRSSGRHRVDFVWAPSAAPPLRFARGSRSPFWTIVFKMCKDYDWDYLSFRMWTGLYISLILLLFVAFDLSALVKYITRFTEESFAGLIALIFIVEAVKKLLFIGKEYPVNRAWHPTYATKFDCRCYRKSTLNDTDWKPLKPGQHLRLPSYKLNGSEDYYANYSGFNYWSWDWYETNRACENNQGEWRGEGCGSYFVPDVFFFSCLLFIGTFAISYGLKMMRNSCFFPNRVRSIISDFAVMLAIVAMTGADLALGLHTPKLNIRTHARLRHRGWLIKPLGNRGQNPWYTIIIAVFPALLATILIFMDQQITAVIVNRKENRLKKGKGYHLDLLVVAVLIGINSVLGIPWFVAATVLSINHVISLKIESESTAPGERPKFLGCRENRLTGFLIFLLIGLSVFMTPILKHIPMPVLYGVFLFMGISSLNGLQLVQRTGLFFMPQKYQPDYIFLRHVKIGQVHKFTVIQIACLVVLWVVKAIKAISILFPIMVLAMCFIRKALDFVFDQSELKWIDDIMPPITVSLGRKRNSGDEGGAASGAPGAASSGRQPITIELDMNLKQPAATQHFNVSNEVDRTSIWKNLTGAGGNADGGKSSKKQKKRSSKKTSSSSAAGGNEDVGGAGKLDDADKEAAEALLKMPEIVVEPPSGCNSPERRSSNA
uniref:Anion exchange protein n=1 Tax=Macrostomum lignano TaxID=282301 RepID=A0A1I8GLP3_9PLAT